MYNVIIYKLCYKWLLAYCFVLRHSYIIIYGKFDVYIYIPDISMSSIEVKYLSAIMQYDNLNASMKEEIFTFYILYKQKVVEKLYLCKKNASNKKKVGNDENV